MSDTAMPTLPRKPFELGKGGHGRESPLIQPVIDYADIVCAPPEQIAA